MNIANNDHNDNDDAYDKWLDRQQEALEERVVYKEEMERLSGQGAKEWEGLDFDRELANAVDEGDIFKAEYVLAKGADPNGVWTQRPDEGANESNDVIGLVERLNFSDKNRIPMLDVLVEGGLDLGQVSFLGVNDPEVATRMLAAGADPNKYSPLISDPDDIYRIHNPEVARLLLDAGCDPNATDQYGRTALHTAANGDIVNVLLEHGANIEAVDSCGQTAYQTNDNYGCPNALRSAGANTFDEQKFSNLVEGVDAERGLDANSPVALMIAPDRPPCFVSVRPTVAEQTATRDPYEGSEQYYKGTVISLSDDGDVRQQFLNYLGTEGGQKAMRYGSEGKYIDDHHHDTTMNCPQAVAALDFMSNPCEWNACLSGQQSLLAGYADGLGSNDGFFIKALAQHGADFPGLGETLAKHQFKELQEMTNSWSPADLSGDHLVPKSGQGEQTPVQRQSRRL